MALPEDLLRQARFLALKEPRRPQQASLRRAISTAYYSLFHLLSKEGGARVCATNPPSLAAVVQRSLSHSDMKSAARALTQTNLPRLYLDLMPGGVPRDLVDVAQAFVVLQEERHAADYDTNRRFDRLHALAKVGEAEDAFRKWRAVRASPEAVVFLTLMFFWKSLSNR